MGRESGRDAIAAAIEILGRKDLSVSEIRQKLESGGFSAEEIDRSVARLEERRILNDRRLAGRLAESLRKKGFSDTAIRQKLASRGIADEAAESAVGDCTISVADILASKRWKSAGQAARFLAARGHDPDEVREAIESHFQEHDP